MKSHVLLLLLLLGCVLLAEGYKNGKVERACVDMTPQHSDNSAQTGASPFTVSTEKTNYSAGEEVTVFLRSSSSAFEGFLLQAREDGSTAAVGSFVSAPSGTQTLTCGSKDSALSHTSSAGTTSVQVKWKPASNNDVQFFATFVQSYKTYWVALSSPKVQFNGTGDLFSGSSTPSALPAALALIAHSLGLPDEELSLSGNKNQILGWKKLALKTSQGSSSQIFEQSPVNFLSDWLLIQSQQHISAPHVRVHRAFCVANFLFCCKTVLFHEDVLSLSVPNNVVVKKQNISAGGCGVSKVCFRDPPGCDPALDPASCYFLSAMVVSPGSSAIQYHLSGPSDGYISFGFSDDQEMGDDDIYMCVLDSSGQLQLQHAVSTGTVTPQNVSLGNVWDIKMSVQDRVIRCSFTSTNSISTQRSSSSQSYYLLYARGPSSNGQIQIHTKTFVSGQKVDISKPAQVQRAQTPSIIRAHGALMLVAWMGTGSLGMMVARFNKGLAKGHTVCGKDLWFVVHVLVMCLTLALTIIAFILVFSHARTWSGGAHPVLGCLVMIMSLLQPLGAVLRCGPEHPKRFLFNWSHALNALAIKALSVAAILTGLKLIDSSGNQWLMKVMGGFMGWEAVFFLLSDLNLRWSQKSPDTHRLKVVMDGPLVPGLFLLGNLAFLVALLAGIGLS
ncbi:putative ferric-chelate reductase 1 [Eucyclogobius newberryi]|uniref:putative ferric-chelate reductase 1 n=1 Tax=Eucyclogobius newberryi TaxID=166745 RepID=UPI003B5C7907